MASLCMDGSLAPGAAAVIGVSTYPGHRTCARIASVVAAPVPLVGRGAERAAVADALRSLPGGTGRVVLLAGEPGIGKTRLLAELAAQAAAEGWSVRTARASEFEADLPYALFADA